MKLRLLFISQIIRSYIINIEKLDLGMTKKAVDNIKICICGELNERASPRQDERPISISPGSFLVKLRLLFISQIIRSYIINIVKRNLGMTKKAVDNIKICICGELNERASPRQDERPISISPGSFLVKLRLLFISQIIRSYIINIVKRNLGMTKKAVDNIKICICGELNERASPRQDERPISISPGSFLVKLRLLFISQIIRSYIINIVKRNLGMTKKAVDNIKICICGELNERASPRQDERPISISPGSFLVKLDLVQQTH